MRDAGLERLFEALPREAAPQIAVESLLRRLFLRRLLTAATILLALAGGATALVLTHESPEPPVNLQIRVVEPTEAIAAPTQGPAEFNLP